MQAKKKEEIRRYGQCFVRANKLRSSFYLMYRIAFHHILRATIKE